MAFIKHSGSLQEEDIGNLLFTLSGISEVFIPSQGTDVSDVQQVLNIRRFLERAGVEKDGTIAQPERSATQGDMTEKEQHSHYQSWVNAEQNRRTA